MLSFDLDQAQRFINLLHGDAETSQYFQVFHDSETSADQYGKTTSFFAKLNDCVEYFNGVQAHNYGIYVTLNKTDGKGREEKNIIGYKYVFADFDNKAIPDLPLEPTFITQRDELHSHCYWRIHGIVTDDQFTRMQKRAAVYLKSDPQVWDVSRVVRVAGSYNCKNHLAPAMYNIVAEKEDKTPYTLEAFEEAFKLSGDDLTKYDNWTDAKQALTEGDGYNDLQCYRDEFVSWLKRAPAAVKGEGRSYQVIKVVSMARDLGIELPVAQQLVWEHYNPRIEPPYTEQERIKKLYTYVKRAYKYANNAIGCSTASAYFKANAPEIIEPPCGWAENAKLAKKRAKHEAPLIEFDQNKLVDISDEESKHITKEQGAILLAQATSKTSVWDLAITFLGNEYPNGRLIRNKKTFYKYVGTHWKEIDDEEILSEITWFYSQFHFAVSKINNIIKTVENVVFFSGLERNIWLDGSDDGDYTLSFDNTLVTLKDEVKMKNHDRNFFNENNLTYSYDPSAECPEWIKFLESVFDKGSPFIGSLQEAFGYALTSDAQLQKIILLIGKSRAGKSVITTVLRKLFGSHNTVSPSLESLTESSTIHAMSKAKLYLLNEVTEVHPSKNQLVLGRVKAISGGDPINFHEMYKGARDCTKWGKIFMTANTMPYFNDPSGALANRFWIFPFTKSFVGREDLTLESRLTKPSELAGVMNWAMGGLKRLQANNMRPTIVDEAVDMVNETKRDMFPLADFVDDCCTVENGLSVTNSDLFKAYKYYLKDGKGLSENRFGRALKSSYLPVTSYRFPVALNPKRPRGILGLDLNDEMKALINPEISDDSNIIKMPIAPPTPIKKAE